MSKLRDLLKYDEIGLHRRKDSNGIPRIHYVKKLIDLSHKDLSKESYTMLKRYYLTNKSERYQWKYIFCYFEHLRRGTHRVFYRRFEQIRYEYGTS